EARLRRHQGQRPSASSEGNQQGVQLRSQADFTPRPRGSARRQRVARTARNERDGNRTRRLRRFYRAAASGTVRAVRYVLVCQRQGSLARGQDRLAATTKGPTAAQGAGRGQGPALEGLGKHAAPYPPPGCLPV